MAETQTYSHHDIQRYLQQKMSVKEMHDFERALMDDPFLADALEGYTTANAATTNQHLAEIEAAILNDKQKAKVVLLSPQRSPILRIAAIIVIVVCAGLLTYALLGKNDYKAENSAPLASKQPATTIQNQDTIGPVDKPTAQLDVLPPVAKNTLRTKDPSVIIRDVQEQPARYIANLKSDSTAITGNDEQKTLAMASSEVAAAPMSTNDVASARKMNLRATVVQNQFKGKVTDALGEPLPFATVRANNNSFGTVADAKGNFNLIAADSVIKIDVISPGYVTNTTTIKNNTTNNVVLEDDKMSLSEVVVTGLSKKKKALYNGKANNTTANAEPEGGWTNFEHYLNRQVDSLKSEADDSWANRDVVLEFSLDKEGRPVDIRAVEDADKTTAEKAIQILTKGPKWRQKKKEKKVKITIPF